MDIGETLTVVSPAEWREWLEHHSTARSEIWLVYFKKTSGKRGITYEDSVEEALCFGWIDGQMKSMDAERYAIRFTPRKRRSSWSQTNRSLATRLEREGRMTEAGRLALPADLLQELARGP
jgi:uncharacterized protein YdeI (YjbR/CyaY-like superfamily)